jgi:hypothetical protein
MTWRPQFQNSRNINNVEYPQPNQNNRPNTRGGFTPRVRGRGRGPPKLTNHDPRDPYFYCQYHGRGHSTKGCPETKKNIAIIQQEKAMMSIASSMPNQLCPNFWQPQFNEFPTKSSYNAAISATTTIMATFPAALPSVASNSVNSVTATNPRDIATTTRQFVETKIKFKTSEFESLDIFWNNYAHHKRINHGI